MSIAEFGMGQEELAPLTDVTPSQAAINAQREFLTTSVENGEGGDSLERRIDSAAELIKGEAEKVADPDYAESVGSELETVKTATVGDKLRGVMYGVLTEIEKRIGQGVVNSAIEDGIRREMELAKLVKDGRLSTDHWDAGGRYHPGTNSNEYGEVSEIIGDTRKALASKEERALFVPGGEVSPGDSAYGSKGDIMEKPVALDIGSLPGRYTTVDTYQAQAQLEENPFIKGLEALRGALTSRREAVKTTAELIGNYHPATPPNVVPVLSPAVGMT